jgi:hypothetical protein
MHEAWDAQSLLITDDRTVLVLHQDQFFFQVLRLFNLEYHQLLVCLR